MKLKKSILTLSLLVLSAFLGYAFDGPQSEPEERQIVLAGTGLKPKLADPSATYNESTRMVTIEFPATSFEPYTLSVESMYNTLDYYVTTPLTSVYISPDVVNVNLYLETDGGDLYWGSFEATAAGSME